MAGLTPQGPIRRGRYPELTLPAILVGYAIGILLAVSISYASLKLGFAIEGSELAAILGFGVLRGVLRRSSIIENNINQTIASAVNGASSGMMFSVPALFILGHGESLDKVSLMLGCAAGGILGVAFVIPLRKQMIDFNRLAYPGGIAVAAILKSPGAGLAKARWLILGGVISALAHYIVLAYKTENVAVGAALGLPEHLNVVFYMSLMTIGAAYLAGKGGLFFVAGGFVCYWFLAPILDATGELPIVAEGQSVAGVLRADYFRPVGIGMLIGGALTGIALALPLVISAVRSMQSASRSGSSLSKEELPVKLLYGAIVGASILLFVIAMFSTDKIEWWRAAAMALLGTLWIWMAGVILSECIGRTNWSPLSGMTLIGITILILVSRDLDDRAAMVSCIVVGAAMCVAMSQATDLMMDLKTGYLVGATPRKQQVAQFLGTWLGPIVVTLLIFALHEKYELGSDELPAPQGQALATVIQGIVDNDAPFTKYFTGAGLGALLSASGIGGLGVLVGLGFYMPFSIVLTYSIGTVLRLSSDRFLGEGFSRDVGIPMAAGLIVGEALVGVYDVVASLMVVS